MTDPCNQWPRVGCIGVGYMGHGVAKNILSKGYPLMVLGNRNRAPVEDLLARGAREARNPADMARHCDVVFLCLPSSTEVEAAVFGDRGILGEARSGLILVDSTTSDPASTRRIGAALAERGTSMLDAPLGRTPREAEAGTLSTFVGGDRELIARIRPVIEAFASTIVLTGELGTGHTMKLVNNFLAIATSAVVGEGLAAALKLGLDMNVLKQVVDTGGGNSVMFQRYAQWVLHGDDSHFQAQMSIATKDLKYYRKIAEENGCATGLADAASQLYHLVNMLGHGRQFMPVLPTILANLADRGARPLPTERVS